jgi:hypothetical protein
MQEDSARLLRSFKQHFSKSKVQSTHLASYQPLIFSFGLFGNLDESIYFSIAINATGLIVNLIMLIDDEDISNGQVQ